MHLRDNPEAGGITQGACGLEQVVLKFTLAALLSSYFPWKTFLSWNWRWGEPLVLRLSQLSLSSSSLTPKHPGGSLAHTQRTQI